MVRVVVLDSAVEYTDTPTSIQSFGILVPVVFYTPTICDHSTAGMEVTMINYWHHGYTKSFLRSPLSLSLKIGHCHKDTLIFATNSVLNICTYGNYMCNVCVNTTIL